MYRLITILTLSQMSQSQKSQTERRKRQGQKRARARVVFTSPLWPRLQARQLRTHGICANRHQ